MAQRTKNDNYADSYQLRVNKGEYRPLARAEEQAARKLVIRALYAIPRDDQRRKEIRRHEIACILGVSDSTLGRAISGEELAQIHGRKVPAERILQQSGDAEKRKAKAKRQQEDEGVDQCYDLDKFHDKWLKKASPKKWREIEDIIHGPEPQMPTPAQTKTLGQAETWQWAVVFNKLGEIDKLSTEVKDILRAIQAGKTAGLVTLADAMTHCTWASTKRREQARKVWLRVLAAEQKRIDTYREQDRRRVIKTERADLEHALPHSRNSGQRPPRLDERI